MKRRKKNRLPCPSFAFILATGDGGFAVALVQPTKIMWRNDPSLQYYVCALPRRLLPHLLAINGCLPTK